jgi:glucose/arabinose dehydrogenase
MPRPAVRPPLLWYSPTSMTRPCTASEFIGGFQPNGNLVRVGRPSGIAVGPKGSLFVSDDQTGLVYRIRPVTR